jgi:peptidoglycan/LPS O-acetylase OafA/YrhL
MTPVRRLAIFLRIVAGVQMLTFAVVVMPVAWIAAWHVWLGMGAMPDDPVLRYVIRGAAFAQGGVGVLAWVIATDVVRYRPLVLTVAAVSLCAAPAYYFIDATAGMPRFWCLFDFAYCLVAGAVLLALCLLSSPSATSRPPQP